MIITDLWKALKAGEELANPTAWKKGQELTTIVGTIVAGVIAIIKWKFPEVEIPDVVRDYAIEVIAGALVVVNLYLNRATTQKIGF